MKSEEIYRNRRFRIWRKSRGSATPQAHLLVNADQVTANGTAPAGSFGFEEMGKAVILYLIEVVDKAHGILGTVTFIDLTEAGTR
jgi:hypothetical protein